MTEEDVFCGLSLSDDELDGEVVEQHREMCAECERPARVCWCSFVPDPKIEIQSEIVILQHPNEIKRGVRTAKMAANGIADGKCAVYRGRKFPGQSVALREIFQRTNAYILFPGSDSIDLTELKGGPPFTFIILDGTWDEAKKLYIRNPTLHAIPKVRLTVHSPSQYVVRTQPADHCLSTVETVAHSLAAVEGIDNVVDRLVKPLHALCNFQIHFGAVKHDSKEFKEENNMFAKKRIPKRKQLQEEHCKKNKALGT